MPRIFPPLSALLLLTSLAAYASGPSALQEKVSPPTSYQVQSSTSTAQQQEWPHAQQKATVSPVLISQSGTPGGNLLTPAPKPTPPTTTPTPPTTTPTPNLTCSVMGLGQSADLNGYVPFATSDPWRKDISGDAVDPTSAGMVGFLGASKLYANFGAGRYAGNVIGIPYSVVSGVPFSNITYNMYGSESDPGPMPIPTSTQMEGYPNPGNGDRHVLVVDRDNCWLYELYGGYPQGDGTWKAASGAVWDMLNFNARPYKWTSTDAAGLPVFPGLVRYDEVQQGHIDHAIRVTLSRSRAAFVAPASHWAGNNTSANAAVMGMRLRLKANFDISSYPPQSKVILTALKKYGMIMADNGSNLFMIGAPDERWDNDDLAKLKQVPASAFDVVKMGTVYTASNVPTGAAPTISTLTADKTSVASGTAVKLSWSSTNATYFIVSPEIGAVRGTSATVRPTKTTTYTLYATNQFNRSSKTITITVK